MIALSAFSGIKLAPAALDRHHRVGISEIGGDTHPAYAVIGRLFADKFNISALGTQNFKLSAVKRRLATNLSQSCVMTDQLVFGALVPDHRITAERIAQPLHTSLIAVIDTGKAIDRVLKRRYHTQTAQSCGSFGI